MPKKDRAAYNDYMARYMLQRYHSRRGAILTDLGGECVQCGANDNLEIDHADASQKSFDIARMWSLAGPKLDAELAKCQLLCAPCHRSKTTTDKGHQHTSGRHGTLSTYRHCKCDECRAAKAAYNRAYKARQKAA